MDMRERFEKWLETPNSNYPTIKEKCWQLWQAALSSAGTSGLTRFPCECGRLYLVEGKVIGKNVVNDPLRGDSLSGKGATKKCPKCGGADMDYPLSEDFSRKVDEQAAIVGRTRSSAKEERRGK